MEKEGKESLSLARNRPEVTPVNEVVEEAPDVKSLYFDSQRVASESEPGQFLMIWVIGEDEIPMAVSRAEGDGTVAITVERVGDATSKLHELEKGDLIGVRGPYGNGFDLTGDDLLIVGGGCGMAPLGYVAEKARSVDKEVTVVISAENDDRLVFKSRIENLDLDLFISTEDGSAGVKGLATDVLEQVLQDSDFDSCLICGPERMMAASAELVESNGIPVQVSLNRYMKCAVGICGSCTIDPSGLRVCEEGPVFSYEDIKDGEFGDYKRDASGRKVGV